MGDTSPLGSFDYARWENEKEYFLLDSGFKKVFGISLYSLRFKKIFTVPEKEITKLRFRSANGEYEMAKRDSQWFWMEPLAA